MALIGPGWLLELLIDVAMKDEAQRSDRRERSCTPCTGCPQRLRNSPDARQNLAPDVDAAEQERQSESSHWDQRATEPTTGGFVGVARARWRPGGQRMGRGQEQQAFHSRCVLMKQVGECSSMNPNGFFH